jgi:hypothetical protein
LLAVVVVDTVMRVVVVQLWAVAVVLEAMQLEA